MNVRNGNAQFPIRFSIQLVCANKTGAWFFRCPKQDYIRRNPPVLLDYNQISNFNTPKVIFILSNHNKKRMFAYYLRALNLNSSLRCNFIVFLAVQFSVADIANKIVECFANQRNGQHKPQWAPICNWRADLNGRNELTARHKQKVQI